MKWLALGSVLFLAMPLCAYASSDAPPQAYLSGSGEVLLTKVDSVNGKSVVFSITEVLKGLPRPPLVLKPTPGLGEVFRPGEKYILCWMGEASEKGVVCSTMLEGTPEWKCVSVVSDGGKVTVSGVGSLEKVREICASKPSP